jgi:hypothetical protein
VSCTQSSDPCRVPSGHCGTGGVCEFDFSPNTTPCGSDSISCTSDHCDGAGSCVHENNCAQGSGKPFCCTCNGGVCAAGGPGCDNATPGICRPSCTSACGGW